MTQEILKALNEGDLTKVVAYAAIFALVWIEVRGLKKEVSKLNATIAKSFAEGEHRFTEIEKRLNTLELKPMGDF